MNGAEALAVVDAWAPHLVLMDMHMPVMDGFAATRAIRARRAGARPAIVAVTASAFDDTRDAIFEAGADGWLRKPCREVELLDEIASAPRRPVPLRRARVRSMSPSRQMPAVRRGEGGALPPEFVAVLRKAAIAGDYERLHELIGAIPVEQTRLAEELRGIVDRYAYDEIEDCLKRAGAQAPTESK